MAKKKSKVVKLKEEDIACDDDPAAVSVNAYPEGSNNVGGGEDKEVMDDFLQIDLGDVIKMKQVMDESAVAAVFDHAEAYYYYENLKLVIMSIACMFAMMAQFVPIPFPESLPVVGACGAMYFVMSGVLQLITIFIDKDFIAFTKPAESGGNKLLQKYGVGVRSKQERFSEHYTIIMEFHMDKKAKAADPAAAALNVEETWSVGQFFDGEGYFDEVNFEKAVIDVYKRFEDGKYDNRTITEEKKKQ